MTCASQKIFCYGFSLFQLQFGWAPNTELSIAAERGFSCVNVNLDNQQLEWDLLTAEKRR